MQTQTLALFCALCVSCIAAQPADFSQMKTCKRGSSDYSSCMRLAFQENWPTIVRGIPVIDLPQLDPFHLDVMSTDYEFGEVTGKIVVRNVKSYGLAKTRFLSIRSNHEDNRYRLEIDLEIPKMFVEGDFKSDGTIGSFNVMGKGEFNVSMEDVSGTMTLEGEIINDRWVLDKFNFMPEVGNMKVWASDLFNGNKELTKAALTFANQYWQILYRGMLPHAAKSWNAYMINLCNRILSNLSFSKLFP
ncbi:uncharacterized protein LOC130676554 [Microplitis mediator]|uniref:uncharacterized protein LOC130676554 n=1 Tax=Microplitis mediator TaxID=375433 RepID=UPI002553B6BF|nr:uncharacterized protein LOC130676554 [Microplitis mediator]